jgi:hypothetical protein
MKEFNLMIAGFCGATSLINLMAEQYIMAGIVLFCAVLNYNIARTYE